MNSRRTLKKEKLINLWILMKIVKYFKLKMK